MRNEAPKDLWVIERERIAKNTTCICGVDEAGRGPLAGPVYAAAVILPPETVIEGLNDSKKLSDAKRRALFPIICEKAIAYGIGSASETEIDELNILQATFLAMRRALDALTVRPELVLVDGNRAPNFGIPSETVIQGDGKSANIAAASILAKVSRDIVMEELDKTYPQYGFAVHKGYGTKAHYEALRQYGPCAIHRRTFLRSLYGD